MTKIKIGFLSEYSPLDKRASSGTNYKFAEYLNDIGNVQWIQVKKTLIGKIIHRISAIINRKFKKNYLWRLTPFGSKLSYNISKFKECDYDVIVAFFCIPALYKIKTQIPIIYFSDATFPVLINYYSAYSNLSGNHISKVLNFERIALNKATLSIFSSNWAKNGALKLGIDENKIRVVEFGVNINDTDVRCDKRDNKLPLKILFSGVDWERKGGNIAVNTINWLNDNGIPSTLHIVGVIPPSIVANNPNVICYGFKNKNNLEEYNDYINLIKECDILLLPTIAECAGIVFAEASAYGLPIFTHDTGGISNYVINGINGYRLPIGSNSSDFGLKIKEAYKDNYLNKLSEGGRKLYLDKLNWNRWRDEVEKEILNIINILK